MPDDLTLGRRLGITDEYLRVWRVILSNAGGAASLLDGQVFAAPSQQFAGTAYATVMQQAGMAGTAGTTNVSSFSSEWATGQTPVTETYAAGLRLTFTVTQRTTQTPNTAEITLYNLADDTASQLIEEFNFVILQAGYLYGAAGTIFAGTIKYYLKGHESATDTYLKLYCADADQAINGATVSITQPAGTTAQQQQQNLRKTMEGQMYNVSLGYAQPDALKIPNLIRPNVMYGTTADKLRDFSQQNGAMWWIYNQRFHYALPTSYVPGEIVQLTGATGLIGWPEITPHGLNVTALINPAIHLMQRIRIDNSMVNQYYEPGGAAGVGFSGKPVMMSPAGEPIQFMPTNADGIYVPYSISYEGDSRGGPWYMHMICASSDATSDLLKALLAGLDWNFLS